MRAYSIIENHGVEAIAKHLMRGPDKKDDDGRKNKSNKY